MSIDDSDPWRDALTGAMRRTALITDGDGATAEVVDGLEEIIGREFSRHERRRIENLLGNVWRGLNSEADDYVEQCVDMADAAAARQPA